MKILLLATNIRQIEFIHLYIVSAEISRSIELFRKIQFYFGSNKTKIVQSEWEHRTKQNLVYILSLFQENRSKINLRIIKVLANHLCSTINTSSVMDTFKIISQTVLNIIANNNVKLRVK